jgi:hypothetical protein
MLATIFYRLCDERKLDAVSVCELALTCRDLSVCARNFWREAEMAPGSQARRFARRRRRGGGVFWSACSRPTGARGATWRCLLERALELGAFEKVRELFNDMVCCGHYRGAPWVTSDCSVCGGTKDTLSFLFDPDFDGARLCRICYAGAVERDRRCERPIRDRPLLFRVSPVRELAVMYHTSIPRELYRQGAVRRLRLPSSKLPPVFEFDEPHGSVRRVAMHALLHQTPRQMQAHWRLMHGARAVFKKFDAPDPPSV